jgi:hypothetical protein
VNERVVEQVIGRLATDEDFRREFAADPVGASSRLPQRGAPMSAGELAAIVATDLALWERAAEAIDPRLQRASLKPR